MDLDALAGIISYKHVGNNVTVVTAAVDRVTIRDPPTELCDLIYSGQVTYATGRSSMEITCQVSRAPADGRKPRQEDVFLTCMFTMVALDPSTKKATNIAPLIVSTDEERRLFELGETRSKQKKTLAQASLRQRPPNAEESGLVHNMWLAQIAYHDPNNEERLPSNVHMMASTKLDDTAIMQPQFRNIHQFQVFGGFLMRQAYELAFTCCANFARARPSFVSLDPSRFMNPVPVGSVLYLSAVVAYTDPPLVRANKRASEIHSEDTEGGKTRVQIRVDTKVRDVEHGTSKPTGQFNYTFMVDKDVKVMPQTYSEYMIYIDAFRRVQQSDVDMRHEGVSPSSEAGNRITE